MVVVLKQAQLWYWGNKTESWGDGELEELARTAEHSCCLHMHEEEEATPGTIIQVMCYRRLQITV